MPEIEPAAADRDDDRVDVRRVLQDLEADRPLAGDHERVVERVDEHAARLREVLLEAGEGLRGTVGLEVDRGAERAGAVDLGLARRRAT